MKTAHCKYNFANQEMIVDVYFEPKAFDLISPPLNGEGLDDVVRKICDSMAYAIPKENLLTRFYIKKVFLLSDTNQIKLLCTDGFLVDPILTLTINQQPFAKERIVLSDVESVPAKFRLSNEILKTLNDRLLWFEDDIRKMTKGRVREKEFLRTEKTRELTETPIETSQSFLAERTFDVLSEIGMIKKEINEIAKSRTDSLDHLLNQVSEVRKRIYDEVMRDKRVDLKNDASKKSLSFAVNNIIDRYNRELDQKIALVKQKASEIKPVTINIDNEIEEISAQITRLSNMIVELKELTISNLYGSAKEYSKLILPKIQEAAPNARKMIIHDFNRKFDKVAKLSDDGQLSSLNETDKNLRNLTLETLQDIISNDDKNHLGVLQKCNTSWSQESEELQIVLRNLGQLNLAYKAFFQDHYPDFPFAKEDIVEITRTPFPRSYQFRFTKYAFECRKIAEDFCKSKKETISNIAMEYKKKMQLDDVIDKTKRAMVEVNQVSASIKNAVFAYLDFLTNKELSEEIVESIKKDHEEIMTSFNEAKHIQSLVMEKVDEKLKKLKKKINVYARDIQLKADAADTIFERVKQIEDEVSSMVKAADLESPDAQVFRKLNEKIKSLKAESKEMADVKADVKILNQKFALYHQVMTAGAYDFSEIKRQQAEAKNLVAQLIRDKATTISEERRKKLIDIYTKIETGILNIDKLNNEIESLKRQFLVELNKLDLTDEIFENRMQVIRDTLSLVTTEENEISENLARLKTL